MKRLKFISFFLLLSIFCCIEVHSQNVDSLRLLDYSDLETLIKSKEEKTKIKLIYIEAYKQKAYKDLDSLRIGESFFFKAAITPALKNRLALYDSTIYYTKKLKSSNFPAYAYFKKGTVLHQLRQYIAALDNYLLANNTFPDKNNSNYYILKFNIGFIQRIIGDYEEALDAFYECLHYYEKKALHNRLYHGVLFQISNVHLEKGQYNKATQFNKQGIQSALNNELTKYYYLFVCNQGENLAKQGKFHEAIDSLQKATPHLKNSPDQTIGYFYLAKSLYGIKQKEKAMKYFRKIDTFFSKTSYVILPLRESYEFLIHDAKQRRDKELQLYYTNQLLKFDSIHLKTYKDVSKAIAKEYDIPRLLEEKEKLIADLKEKTNNTSNKFIWSITIGILTSILASIGLLYFYRQNKKYQKQYEAIIAKNKSKGDYKNKVKAQKTIDHTIELDENAIQTILDKLQVFENENQFLTNQITLQDVARKLQTNSRYLSKIINVYKEKTFTHYINDLRIEYLIDRLQNDTTFDKYTIKAIAHEIGFTNSATFYRAFYKKIGLKPSYFIKKVRKSQ